MKKFSQSLREEEPLSRGLARRIRELRKAAGLSQTELSRRLGRANNNAVSRLERSDAGFVGFDVLAGLLDFAQAHGHDANWLFGLTGQADPAEAPAQLDRALAELSAAAKRLGMTVHVDLDTAPAGVECRQGGERA